MITGAVTARVSPASTQMALEVSVDPTGLSARFVQSCWPPLATATVPVGAALEVTLTTNSCPARRKAGPWGRPKCWSSWPAIRRGLQKQMYPRPGQQASRRGTALPRRRSP